MKSRMLATAACALLSLAASAAMAQDDGVQNAGPQQYWAKKDIDSGSRQKAFPGAQNTGPYNMKTWKFGPAADIPASAVRIWNPAMIKLRNGGQLFSATVNGHQTPEEYCTQANIQTNDFIWTEMQHSPGSWQNVALMWGACPHAHAVPGARIPNANEMDEQHATDMGALVLVIPTVRDKEEAQLGANWAFYPPLGHRSSGTGAAPGYWNQMAGGAYRQTINDNLVLVEMIETLDGIQNIDEIASVKGVTALFAASGDLGNFSGYRQGDPDYERLINIVHDTTLRHHLHLCGPSAWATRPNFDCFQGGPPGTGRGGAGRGGRGAGAVAPPA